VGTPSLLPLCTPAFLSGMSDRIVKLVFIRAAGPEGPQRKAVVPLVEGCDFEQFLGRVRRRIGLPDHLLLYLSDAASEKVDTIDRLLEV
jgi:hypothetical protein